MAAGLIRASELREPERESSCNTEVSAFCKLILEVTFYHFHSILYIPSKSLGPALTQEQIAQSVTTRRWGSLRAELGGTWTL